MDRRTFLRAASLTSLIGMGGCSSLLDSARQSTPVENGSTGPKTPTTERPTPRRTDSPTATASPTEETSTTATATDTPAKPQPRTGAALSGVYVGDLNLSPTLSAFDSWLAQKPAVVMVFVDGFWSDTAKQAFVDGPMTTIWDSGHVPLVTWQPFLSLRDQTSERIEREIASGRYDSHLEAWGRLLAEWTRPTGENARGRRLYFRPAHEMNGNWFPWSAVDSSQISSVETPDSSGEAAMSPTGSPEAYVDMWRRFHRILSAAGLGETDIQWVWSPNADEIGGVRAERYYPGDRFVDWVGLDGFNFGDSQSYSSWRTPTGLFDSMLDRIRELTDKPVALSEVATSSFVGTATDGEYRPSVKAEWIETVHRYVRENDIKMLCWFNVDKTGTDESDWAVFGGSRGTSRTTVSGRAYYSYESYKQAATAPAFLGARTDSPTLLTDEEFAGRF